MSATTGGPSAGRSTRDIPVLPDASEDEAATAQPSSGAPRRKKNVRPNRPKVARQAPTGKPIPQKGLRKALYELNKTLGRPDIVPKLGHAAQFEYDIALNEALLRKYIRLLPISIAFVNLKGGASKSIMAIYMGAVIARVGGRPTFLMPATSQHGTSTVSDYAGVSPEDDDVLTLTQSLTLFKQCTTFEEISPYLPQTPEGLYYLTEDEEDQPDNVSKSNFLFIRERMRPLVSTMLFDTGNDNTASIDSVVRTAVEMSDVVVFTATAIGAPLSLRKLSTSIGRYVRQLSTDRNIPRDRGVIRKEDEIPTAEKAGNSIAVVSGIRQHGLFRKERPSDYQKYTMRRDPRTGQYHSVGFEGVFTTVRFDRRMQVQIEEQLPTDSRLIDSRTYLDLLKLCVATYRKAAELKGINLDTYVPPRTSLTGSSAEAKAAS